MQYPSGFLLAAVVCCDCSHSFLCRLHSLLPQWWRARPRRSSPPPPFPIHLQRVLALGRVECRAHLLRHRPVVVPPRPHLLYRSTSASSLPTLLTAKIPSNAGGAARGAGGVRHVHELVAHQFRVQIACVGTGRCFPSCHHRCHHPLTQAMRI